MIETPRLILRRWKDSDRDAFAAINADLEVMEFFPAPLTPAQRNALVDKIESHFRKHGFGVFAAELRCNNVLAGFIGLNIPSFHAHFTPCIEIGWRLGSQSWGQGLATEGAQAVLE